MRCAPGNTLRRILLGPAMALVAVLAGAGLLAAPAGAAEVGARSADSFVDSIGVNTHTYYDDTAYYTRFDTVVERLRELGVRHVREGLMTGREDQYRMLNELAADGIRSTLIMGEPELGADGLAELLATVKTKLPGAVEAVEGPNEYDSRGVPDWAAKLSAYQQQLYAGVKSDPALAALPVIGPSVVQKRNQEALGNISGSLDFGNVHPYPLDQPPERNVSSYLARAALNSGSKPVMATESGYHNTPGWTGEQPPVSEAAAATYMPRLFLDYFERGYARTFAYELLDQGADPSQRDANWGLLRADLSPKPAFTAIRNLISVLADPGPSFAPESLSYELGGDRAGLHQLLLQKRDGSFYLALWREQSVANGPVDVSPPAPSTVRVRLDRPVLEAQRFDPTGSAGATPVGQSGGELSVPVGAQVTILRLVLGAGGGSGRITVWLSRNSVPAGGTVAVGGRLPHRATLLSRSFEVQRWNPAGRNWKVVGRGRASASGKFRKSLRVPAGKGRVSRLRVVAGPAKPSKPLRLRVRHASRAQVGGVGDAVAVAQG